jgi:hypothetical protein
MNWRRGLLRIWLVVSIVWILLVAWDFNLACALRDTESLRWYCRARPPEGYYIVLKDGLLLTMFLPSLAILVIALVAKWVGLGFQKV